MPDLIDAQAPDTGGGAFAAVATAIPDRESAWRGEWEKAAARQKDVAIEREATMAPRLLQAERDMGAIAEAGRAKVQQLEASKPQLTAAPTLGLRPFLAASKDEAPESAVGKLMQAIGLFAMGVGGLTRGNARTGLAAMAGALKGWQEGDRERANRQFGEWRANTTAALDQWQVESDTYEKWFKDAGLTVDQILAGLKLTALRQDNKAAIAALESNSIEKFLGFMNERQQAAESVAMKMATIVNAKEVKENQLKEQERFHRAMEQAQAELREQRRQHDAQMFALAQQRREDTKDREEGIVKAFSPDALKQLGQDYFLTGRVPAGFGGRAAQAVKAKIVEAGVQWAKDNGIDPMSAPSIRAEVAANRGAVADLEKRQSQVMSFVNNFDSAVKFARTLSETVDRTQSPVFNRYLLKVRGQYLGDEQVAAFETQMNVIAQEYSKIMVGNAQGDANTREHARGLINAALNPKQLASVFDTLLRDTEYRRAGYDQEKKTRLDFLKNVAGDKPAAAPGGGVLRFDAQGNRLQ